MPLPFLNLATGTATAPVVKDPLKTSVTRAWLKAVGERPDLPSWKGVGRRRHRWLHELAVKADDYESVYEELPAKQLMAQDRYSVEHVVPRSKTDDASDLEADPYNWVMATRKANSTRSSLPLKLWPNAPWEFDNPEYPFETIDGARHYVPPSDQRARLARKWLYAHATYPHDIEPPSVAQLRNLGQIVALARCTPVARAEQQVADALHNLLGYSNPLLTEQADRLYDLVDWYELLGATSSEL